MEQGIKATELTETNIFAAFCTVMPCQWPVPQRWPSNHGDALMHGFVQPCLQQSLFHFCDVVSSACRYCPRDGTHRGVFFGKRCAGGRGVWSQRVPPGIRHLRPAAHSQDAPQSQPLFDHRPLALCQPKQLSVLRRSGSISKLRHLRSQRRVRHSRANEV